MHDGSTKMVSVAHALSEALGADAKKYEKAMAKRLEKESQDSLPFETLDLQDGEFPYILRNEEGTVYIGTQDNFDWESCHGGFPERISEDMALYYHKEESWVLAHAGPLHPAVIADLRAQMESRRKFAMENEQNMIDLEDDSWDGWEDDEDEDQRPLRRRERKDRKKRDKEKTLQRRKQRERKIIYRSDDQEVPVYGFSDDWE